MYLKQKSLPADVLVKGRGSLVNLPDLEQLINGVAQRLEIAVSGVSDEVLRYATEDALSVPGAAVHIGRISFDANLQQNPVVWEWRGVGQNLSIDGDDNGDGRTRSILLNVASGATTRSRAPLAFFTDSDQKRSLSPTDDIFSHVGAINAGTSRRWGPK